MLKDFSDLSSGIFKIHDDLEVLQHSLTNADLLKKGMVAEIEKFKSSAEVMLNDFHSQHNKIVNDRFPLPAESSDSDLFLRTKSSLLQLLTDAENQYSRQADKYRDYLQSKIAESHTNAINLLQEWLSKDHYELPYSTITSKSLSRIEVSIDDIATTKHYTITKTSTAFLQDAKEGNSSTSNSIAYSLSLSGANLDFWNYRRRVSDVDVKDVLIPFGLKTPISEKIRQSLTVIPGLSKEPAEKEPGFVNVDGYYLVLAALDEKDKTLSVTLADNPLELDYNVVKIAYDVPQLYNEKTSAQRYAEGKLPKIDCIIKDGEVQDVLQIKTIAESTDISKIILFGRALMDKMKLLQDPSIWASKSGLVHIQLDEKDALLVTPSNGASSRRRSLHYSPERIIAFLEVIAKNFAPLVRKLKDKSAVSGELILRYEKDDGSREEHVVRMEELSSILSATDNGKEISKLLALDSVTSGTSSTAGAS